MFNYIKKNPVSAVWSHLRLQNNTPGMFGSAQIQQEHC